MRKIILVLLVLCAKIAQAQIYIDSYRFAQATPVNLLLDDYPGAAAAYSLRKLDKDYTGSAIRIRTAGGSETDIGFDSNGDLNTAAITTFCAGTTCTVRTWYDQSGNGRNATQATAANQPTIYTGGAVVVDGGKSALNFATSYLTSSFSAGSNFSFFGVANSSTNKMDGLYDSAPIAADAFRFFTTAPTVSTSSVELWNKDPVITFSTTANTKYLLNVIATITTRRNLFLNINSSTNFSATDSRTTAINWTNPNIGSINNTEVFFTGKIQEIIIYNSDQSTNRTNIETNINSYYSIY